ncbi:hypothetical protein HK100_000433 [Physocladia obscura]|uniref:Protein kinase domain-containing protein n=1 Tax=Physocladia obscura TaxID=109957 RepID=A0AAD5XFL2_9FUNG|nr:hypothetical protein HK100_000433 [Physocladia obscura]
MFNNLLASVSSLASTQPAHGFSIGEAVAVAENHKETGWLLHRGTTAKGAVPVSVFCFNATAAAAKPRLPLARNALKRLKTLRHPAILAFVDGAENEFHVIIGTEPVTPLRVALASDPSLSSNGNFIAFGLYKIASAIKFLNADVSLTHACIRLDSIYVTKSGEWRLGAFDFLSNIKTDSILFDNHDRIPDAAKYLPPELASQQPWSSITENPISAIDSWSFGILLYEIFNNTVLSSRDELTNLSKIPKQLIPHYKQLLNSNPRTRHDVASVFDQCVTPSAYFAANEFIQVVLALEQFGLKDSYEKDQFLIKINNTIDTFPTDFCKHKILPELIKALEFGGGGAKALAPILKIANKLDAAEFESVIVPMLVKMFALPDRAIRVSLCENLGGFIERLSPKVLNDKIFPNLSTGFNDTNAVLRECTLRSVLLIVPKLSERIINNDLLRFLAKLQADEEPVIRSNTTICLGKLAVSLNDSTRRKVLIPAFARSLHDPFPPARNAGLLAFAATSEYYTPHDIATKVIPAFSGLLLDPERTIRTQAFKNMDSFIKKLEKHSATMPEPQEPPAPSVSINGGGVLPVGTGSTAAAAQGSDGWAGWAVGALSSTITRAAVSATGAISSAATTTTTTGSTTTAALPTSPISESSSAARKSDVSSSGGSIGDGSGVTASGMAGLGLANSSSGNGGGGNIVQASGIRKPFSSVSLSTGGVSGMSLKPKVAVESVISDWDNDWDEKPKVDINALNNAAAASHRKFCDNNNTHSSFGNGTDGWGDIDFGQQQPVSIKRVGSGVSSVSSFSGVSSFGMVPSVAVAGGGGAANTGGSVDRELEKQKKREQLALLREQKKAAIAAKKMNQ